MEKVLPKEAYQALDALKKHADIVSQSNLRDESELIEESRDSIFAFQPWTNRIVKALYKTDSSINDVDHNWLERQFSSYQVKDN